MNENFLDIYLTIFFGAGITRNTSATSATFFGKCIKFNIDFENAKKKIHKKFFIFWIIAPELVALNCLYSADNVCH